jgi:hypothetical protein
VAYRLMQSDFTLEGRQSNSRAKISHQLPSPISAIGNISPGAIPHNRRFNRLSSDICLAATPDGGGSLWSRIWAVGGVEKGLPVEAAAFQFTKTVPIGRPFDTRLLNFDPTFG